jgi:hypothetical protein
MPNRDRSGPRREQEGYGRGGRMKGFRAAGPSGYCICPKCGYKESHKISFPCNQLKCPKCGTIMERE